MTVPKIDPRIRSRRVAVRRAEGRRRLTLLLSGLAILGLVFCGWAALNSSLLDLDKIEISGLDSSRLAEVHQLLTLETGTPLKDVDTEPTRIKLEKLPWTKDVAVTKSWPNRVKIDVTERVPFAQLAPRDGQVALVDEGGTIMAQSNMLSQDLPSIQIEPQAKLGEVEQDSLPGLAVLKVLPADLATWVEAITYRKPTSASARGNVGLVLIGAAQAHLGEPTLLEDKVQALRSVLNGVDLTCVDTIDVAVPDFPTIRRNPTCNTINTVN